MTPEALGRMQVERGHELRTKRHGDGRLPGGDRLAAFAAAAGLAAGAQVVAAVEAEGSAS
jgi:hypothetical protein